MNLLIIISQYKPAQTPNTIRWMPIVQHYIDMGYSVSILTTKRKGQEDKDDSKNYIIYRAGHNTLQDYLSDIMGSKKRRNESGQNSHPYRPHALRLFAEKCVDVFWRKYYWPDGSKLFLKPGIALGLNIIKEKKITHVLSVGLPFTCHLIAQALKSKNKTLHWHMDIEDPFSYSKEFWVNNFKRYEKKNLDAERLAFNKADSISVTNETAQRKYNSLFSNEGKLTVVPPLFSSYNNKLQLPLSLNKEKIHLGYFGSFYDGVRSPLLFMQFLKKLDASNSSLKNKIQFHFFGQQNKFSYPIFKNFPELKHYIILHGFYDRDRSVDAMKQMDFLINFGNTTDYHLPSKVVDFLYINKAVINFTQIENDSVKDFLKNYPNILNLHLKNLDDQSSVHFLNFIFSQSKPQINSDAVVGKYDTKTIAQMYLKALNTVV